MSASEKRLAARHLRIGWWSLALFIVLGAALEALHAIKAPFYLDAGRETTRLLLRLAHAHGTGLSIVNIVYGLTAQARPRTATHFASASLLTALVLLPVGFFAGGLGAFRGDPGLGVLLVPAGALALLAGVVAIARRIGDPTSEEES
ncbi:MAG: hypothetical protein U0270_26780 [Labilithrix sp.]